MDEVSQVSGEDFFSLLNNIDYVNHKTMIDGLELYSSEMVINLDPHHVVAEFHHFDNQEISLLDRLAPKDTTVVIGSNTIKTIQFNIQYRMRIQISELSNVIALRNIFTHITRDVFWIRKTVYMNHYIYTGMYTEIDENVVRSCIVRMNPYADQRNAQDRRVRQLLLDFRGILDERSTIEEIAIMDIIRV